MQAIKEKYLEIDDSEFQDMDKYPLRKDLTPEEIEAENRRLDEKYDKIFDELLRG